MLLINIASINGLLPSNGVEKIPNLMRSPTSSNEGSPNQSFWPSYK